MRISMFKAVLAGVALLVLTAVPAQAQKVGVGLSFLEGGTGVTVDYFKGKSAGDKVTGFVGDVSFHHEGAGNDLVGTEVSLNTFMAQGGWRMEKVGNEKLKWFVQGLIGLVRSSVNVSAAGLSEDVCDAFDLDCDAGASDTGFVVTPGAGIDYALSDKRSLRAQLDIPIGDGGSGTRFWVGLAMMLN